MKRIGRCFALSFYLFSLSCSNQQANLGRAIASLAGGKATNASSGTSSPPTPGPTTTPSAGSRIISYTPGGSLSTIAETRAKSDFVDVSDFGARGDCVNDDTGALNAAINASYLGNDYLDRAKTILFKNGACYKITGSLNFQNISIGRLIGNGATIQWQGPAGNAALLFTDTSNFTVDGLTIKAMQPLDAAIKTVNGGLGQVTPTDIVMRNLIFDGNGGRLKYGFWAALGAIDANNDLHVLDNVTIKDFTDAGVKLDHSQVHAVKLYNITCRPFPGAPSSYCALVNAGYVRIHGGSSFGTTAADIGIGVGSNFILSNWESQGSKRLLQVFGPTGATMPVKIISTRFDSSNMAGDHIAIDARGPGPLMVQDSVIGTPGGVAAQILAYSHVPTQVIVERTVFGGDNSLSTSAVATQGSGPHRVTLIGNTFRNAAGAYVDSTGQAAATPTAEPPIFDPRPFVTPSEIFAGNSIPDAIRVPAVGNCGDATQALQAALNQAVNPTTHALKSIVLDPGGCYQISSTLVIDSASGGHLFGNNAFLAWAGNSSSPMLRLRDSHGLLIEDLYIASNPLMPLLEAIRIDSTTSAQSGPVDNTFRHLIIEGTNTNGLKTALSINDTGTDANPNLFFDVHLRNVTDRGVYVNSTKTVKLNWLGNMSAPDATNSYGIYIDRGAIDLLDGGGGYTTASDIYLGTLTSPVRIVGWNSEGPKRFLVTSNATSSTQPVYVSNLRHTSHKLYSNFNYVQLDYRLAGPFTMDSGEYGEGGYVPLMLFGGGGATVRASIRGIGFSATNASSTDNISCAQGGSCQGLAEKNLFCDSTCTSAERPDKSF